VRYRLVPGVWEGGCVDVAGRQLLRSTHGSRIIPYGASWAQADRFEPFAVRSWVGVRRCSRCGDQPVANSVPNTQPHPRRNSQFLHGNGLPVPFERALRIPFAENNDYFLELSTRAFRTVESFANRRIFMANSLQDQYDPDQAIHRQMIGFSELIKRNARETISYRYETYENYPHVPFPCLYDGLRFVTMAQPKNRAD
jgi:hypothetical protein